MKKITFRARKIKWFCLASFFIVFCTVGGGAQTLADRTDNQSWNEILLTLPMTKRFDFIMQLSERFGDNFFGQPVDHRIGIGFVFKPHKSWTVLPYFLSIDARNARSQFRIENRLNLRIGYRLPFKKFGLSHRSTFEWRRRAPQNSWRYRPGISFEKDIAKIIPKSRLFITEEVFYDSILKGFSRNRFTVGMSRPLTKKLTIDVYYLRQSDGFSRPGDLNVIGTTWRVRP
jgi:hypothetical protein